MSWNAKVKCIDAPELSNYTPNKIYNVKESHITSDTGHKSFTKYNSLQDLNDTLYAQFELVEEPTRYTQLAALKCIIDDHSREFQTKREGQVFTLSYEEERNAIVMTSDNGKFEIVMPQCHWLDSEWTEVEKQWMPKDGDSYWTVDFFSEEGVEEYIWNESIVETYLIKSCGVYKTKEEAVEVAKKMLKALE